MSPRDGAKHKLIAENTIRVLAALGKMGNAKKITDDFLAHNHVKGVDPNNPNTPAAWVSVNVSFNDTELNEVLGDVYATGWVFGTDDAKVDLGGQIGMDWDKWQVGNRAAAALLDTPRGLESMLQSRGITLEGIKDTLSDRVGSALANGIANGQSPVEISRAVDRVINDPARALVISRTETARAVIEANKAEYLAEGIASWKWLVGDPENCVCVDLEGEIVEIGSDFSEGIDQPPAHPNCVCDVAPISPYDPEYADNNPSGSESDVEE